MNTPDPPVNAVRRAAGPEARCPVTARADVVVLDCDWALEPLEQAASTSGAPITIVAASNDTRVSPLNCSTVRI
jgi:hypothetical protein